jgi:dTDP-4-amino-4,6-dideoxygalactose transaminase
MIQVNLKGKSYQLKSGDQLLLKDQSTVTFVSELYDATKNANVPVVVDSTNTQHVISIDDIIQVIEKILTDVVVKSGILDKFFAFILKLFKIG